MNGRKSKSAGTNPAQQSFFFAAVLVIFLLFFLSKPAASQQVLPEQPAPAPDAAVPADLQPPATPGQAQPAPEPAPIRESVIPEVPAVPAAQPDSALATAPTRTGSQREEGATPEEPHDFVETVHGGISQGFLASATWLDSFFGDERYEAEINRSQLKIRFDAFREGDTGMTFRRPNFDLRLVLPQLRHKTRLAISGDPNLDVEPVVGQTPSSTTSSAAPPQRNVTTQLQYVPVESNKSNFSIRAGLRFHAGKFEILAGPRYRYLIPLDPWALRFIQEFIWSTDMRWQSRSRIDFERSLPRDLFFRTSLEGLWSENVLGYTYNLSFTLLQPLDHNRALEYDWISTFKTQPVNGLDEELLVFRYRQRFLREWLFLEIAPQYRFPRDHSFDAVPGILFRLEMVFGDIRNIF